MSNGLPAEKAVGLRSPEALPALTRIAYRYCAGFVNRTLARFPDLRSGIAPLEQSLEQALATVARLESELAAAQREGKRLAETLDATLDAAQFVQSEFGDLRAAVSAHHRSFVGQLEVRQGALETMLAAGELTARELGALQMAVGTQHRRLGATLDEEAERYETATSDLRAENERLNAELSALVREVKENESRTALEIEKLKSELNRRSSTPIPNGSNGPDGHPAG